jgi:hypothetical protein
MWNNNSFAHSVLGIHQLRDLHLTDDDAFRYQYRPVKGNAHASIFSNQFNFNNQLVFRAVGASLRVATRQNNRCS